MCKHNPEIAINYDEIFRRGGKNFGNEEFVLFKCPSCGHVYLIDAEVDMVFLDAADLSKRKLVAGITFDCTACGQTLPDEPWIGPKAGEQFRVTAEDVAASDWAWIAK